MFNDLREILKTFINKNKIRNTSIVIGATTIAFGFISYNLSRIIYTTLGTKNYSLKAFFSNNNDLVRTISLVATSALFIYIIYLMFSDKDNNTTNNLGSAKLGNAKSLNGLTGNDGMLLSKTVQLSSNTCFEHIAIIGPTGSGKSSTFFIPNLLNLPPQASAIISDPKGELYKKTKAYNESIGRKCILFAPLQPQHSAKYNPLEVANDFSEVRAMAQNLLINGANAVALSTGKPSGGDSEWINMAVPLWTAALLFCKHEGGQLGNINAALKLILHSDSKQLDMLFSNSTSENVKSQYSIYKQAAESEKTASSIRTVLTSNLQLFDDPIIKEVTESCEFTPEDFKDTPIALYIMCPEQKASYASPFMSIFYTQIINRIMEYTGNDLPVYMMLDEFANIGVIPNFAQLAATCRSRKLSLTVGIQGIEQLHQNYGKENGDSILNNLKSKIFYPGLAPATAQIASQLCGYTTIATESTSEGKEKGSKSTSTSYQRRELLDSDEIRRLPQDEVLLVIHNREPIVDKQNRYYEDKKFSNRSQAVPLPIRDEYAPKETLKEEEQKANSTPSYMYIPYDKQ